MPVASPYAVFRATDLALVPPLRASAAPQIQHPRPRPRKRLAPMAVIQGELFPLQGA